MQEQSTARPATPPRSPSLSGSELDDSFATVAAHERSARELSVLAETPTKHVVDTARRLKLAQTRSNEMESTLTARDEEIARLLTQQQELTASNEVRRPRVCPCRCGVFASRGAVQQWHRRRSPRAFTGRS